MQDSGGSTGYSYDELSRLKSVTYPGNKSFTYSYDAVGNRRTLQDNDGGLTTYSYDSRNGMAPEKWTPD
jgi:YD repeat-containing protein